MIAIPPVPRRGEFASDEEWRQFLKLHFAAIALATGTNDVAAFASGYAINCGKDIVEHLLRKKENAS